MKKNEKRFIFVLILISIAIIAIVANNIKNKHNTGNINNNNEIVQSETKIKEKIEYKSYIFSDIVVDQTNEEYGKITMKVKNNSNETTQGTYINFNLKNKSGEIIQVIQGEYIKALEASEVSDMILSFPKLSEEVTVIEAIEMNEDLGFIIPEREKVQNEPIINEPVPNIKEETFEYDDMPEDD